MPRLQRHLVLLLTLSILGGGCAIEGDRSPSVNVPPPFIDTGPAPSGASRPLILKIKAFQVGPEHEFVSRWPMDQTLPEVASSHVEADGTDIHTLSQSEIDELNQTGQVALETVVLQKPATYVCVAVVRMLGGGWGKTSAAYEHLAR